MCARDEEHWDWSSPEHRIDQVYERFLDRLDDLVRSYWLMRILNLGVFPKELHPRHQARLKHATMVAIALREIGRLHRDMLAPRTAQFLDRLLPTGPEDRARCITFTEEEIRYLEQVRRDIDAEYEDEKD